MKKSNIIIVLLIIAVLILGVIAVASMGENGDNGQTTTTQPNENKVNDFDEYKSNVSVMQDSKTPTTVMELSQVAIKNENFLDTVKSWHDDEYNYYVFEIGQIKNVPLTSTYAIFYYGGGASVTQEKTVVKATFESIETSTYKAVKEFVSEENADEYNVEVGLPGILKKVIGANVEAGYKHTTTNTNSTTTEWSDSYSECVKNYESAKETVSLEFNSSCEQGNYLYLLLGHVQVYMAVIQSIDDPSEYYSETYNSLYADKYALIYTGNDDSFPINKQEKIDIDMSFVPSLAKPEEYIPSKEELPTYEDIVFEKYWDGKVTTTPLNGHVWTVPVGEVNQYIEDGYNKIEIEYEFYTTGGWSILGGNVNIGCYISQTSDIEDAVDHYSVESSRNGKWVNNTVNSDLKWFKDATSICFITDNNNLTEEFTVSKLTFKIRIYRE